MHKVIILPVIPTLFYLFQFEVWISELLPKIKRINKPVTGTPSPGYWVWTSFLAVYFVWSTICLTPCWYNLIIKNMIYFVCCSCHLFWFYNESNWSSMADNTKLLLFKKVAHLMSVKITYNFLAISIIISSSYVLLKYHATLPALCLLGGARYPFTLISPCE